MNEKGLRRVRSITGLVAFITCALTVLLLLLVVPSTTPDGYAYLALVPAVPCALISIFLLFWYFHLERKLGKTRQ
jgi:hypothetical protein